MNFSMIVTFIKPLLPKAIQKAKEKKKEIQLIDDEKDIIIMIYEVDGVAYGATATINDQNHIKRFLKHQEISEFLANVKIS